MNNWIFRKRTNKINLFNKNNNKDFQTPTPIILIIKIYIQMMNNSQQLKKTNRTPLYYQKKNLLKESRQVLMKKSISLNRKYPSCKKVFGR
jgi:subtilase family serine protease